MRMNPKLIFDRERRARKFSVLRKRALSAFRKPCDSRPIFVLGRQRSGTTMLMRGFHFHTEVEVYDEHKNSAAFRVCRLRENPVIHELVDRSRYPFICFKPLADSHRIGEMIREFPGCRIIWMYRDYRDVANSSLRRFPSADGVRQVCSGGGSGGWFQEGVSKTIKKAMCDAYSADLSPFDVACLAWWARNQILVESGLESRVTLLRYENVVTNPENTLRKMCSEIDLMYQDAMVRFISPRSIGKHPAPAMDDTIRAMCDETMQRFDARHI